VESSLLNIEEDDPVAKIVKDFFEEDSLKCASRCTDKTPVNAYFKSLEKPLDDGIASLGLPIRTIHRVFMTKKSHSQT
jgi:hypothetical protein